MAATVADLLNVMFVLNNELRVSANGIHEARAITCLSLAQHYFETIAATLPGVLQGTITAAEAANVETTAVDATLLRLDAMWALDDTTQKPLYKIERIWEVGGQVPALPWPLQLSVATGTGPPRSYYASWQSFYWLPLPDAIHNVRIYGLIEQPEFVNRVSAYNYPLRCKLALANFANKLMNMSVGDADDEIDALALATFTPLLRGLQKFDRSGPMPRLYSDVHYT